ncbi:MAG: 2-C-methyl-D-erythritol 2,4-cyclodiphosphate synthase [Treponema sp.]|nr:2-C-methyl-D-erythritol 2,4-cyclodiphosphate synthase [Candidatus Treponema scatequi]
MKVALIIVAAGSSTRMGGKIKKEYLSLNNGTVLSEAALPFLKSNKITSVTIVCPKDNDPDAQKAFYSNPEIKSLAKNIPVNFIKGGTSRQESVYNALMFLNAAGTVSDSGITSDSTTASDSGITNIPCTTRPDFVLIHDGARPFLSTALVKNSIANTVKYGASVPALTPVDTQKEIDESGFIVRHLTRKTLGAVQTPQGFAFDKILSAHIKAHEDKKDYTDDTEIFDCYNSEKTFVFEGEETNKKITYKDDIKIEDTVSKNDITSQRGITSQSGAPKMIRTGLGYDKHRLVENRKLIIGGVEIPFEKGEDGHSDGDAVLHAVTDAVLGAAHLGDIGSYFPDTDPKYKDADSKKLLSFAWNNVKNAGFELENLDIVLIMQKPKFLPYRDAVIKSIADTLGVNEDKVFIKAKTAEHLGDVGSGLCLEVYATCLLSK